MISCGRFARQAGRHIKKEIRLSLGSFLVLVIVMVLIDLFWIASINISQQYRQMLSDVRMEVYLSETVPDSAISVLNSTLGSLVGVSSVEFVSKDDAARALTADLGAGILDGLDSNPLPRSFVLRFSQISDLAALDAMQSRLTRLNGVDGVEFGRPWIAKIEADGRTITRISYSVGGMILLVVLLTMANTNRLTARSKSQDFFQLRLLGAGPGFLVYPFLAEGFLSGSIAAIIGWVGLYYGVDRLAYFSQALLFPPWYQILVYTFLAGVTGAAGAYLGIRRFLIS
jgi:cell division transport system permease protein